MGHRPIPYCKKSTVHCALKLTFCSIVASSSVQFRLSFPHNIQMNEESCAIFIKNIISKTQVNQSTTNIQLHSIVTSCNYSNAFLWKLILWCHHIREIPISVLFCISSSAWYSVAYPGLNIYISLAFTTFDFYFLMKEIWLF